MTQRHYGLTRAIIGCACPVSNELGAGFLESVYENAMLVALKEEGITAVSQKPIKVTFRGQDVGTFFADLLVEEKVLVLGQIKNGTGRGGGVCVWRPWQ